MSKRVIQKILLFLSIMSLEHFLHGDSSLNSRQIKSIIDTLTNLDQTEIMQELAARKEVLKKPLNAKRAQRIRAVFLDTFTKTHCYPLLSVLSTPALRSIAYRILLGREPFFCHDFLAKDAPLNTSFPRNKIIDFYKNEGKKIKERLNQMSRVLILENIIFYQDSPFYSDSDFVTLTIPIVIDFLHDIVLTINQRGSLYQNQGDDDHTSVIKGYIDLLRVVKSFFLDDTTL